MVHFDGHGVYDRRHGLGMLCFEHPEDVKKIAGRRSQRIDAEEIAKTVLKYRIPLFFLDACESAATKTDPSASVAVLFQEEQDPQLIHEIPAAQVEEVIKRRGRLVLGELPPEPKHQFLGRSRDLLAAERVLSQERYLLVRGSGGEGKTTFAAELARWLVSTRRFGRAAFASVEQVTEARQVLFSLGDQLVPGFASRVGTDDEYGWQLLERALTEHSTLLVIDNP